MSETMPERSVNVGTQNSETDYGLRLDNVSIGSPEPNLSLIEVPFRNGSLDVTDEFGGITYKDRTITFDLIVPWYSSTSHFDIYSLFCNNHHGKRQDVKFSYEPGWYYTGRVKVGDLFLNEDEWGFSVEVTADPFKYQDSNYTYNLSAGTYDYTYVNNGPSVVPTVYVSKAVTMRVNGNSYNLSAGTHANPGFSFVTGSNSVRIVTASTTSYRISYAQGSL